MRPGAAISRAGAASTLVKLISQFSRQEVGKHDLWIPPVPAGPRAGAAPQVPGATVNSAGIVAWSCAVFLLSCAVPDLMLAVGGFALPARELPAGGGDSRERPWSVSGRLGGDGVVAFATQKSKPPHTA